MTKKAYVALTDCLFRMRNEVTREEYFRLIEFFSKLIKGEEDKKNEN